MLRRDFDNLVMNAGSPNLQFSRKLDAVPLPCGRIAGGDVIHGRNDGCEAMSAKRFNDFSPAR